MSADLYKNLMEKNKKYPFHMPGHKRNFDFQFNLDMDITEIQNFDNLHNANGIIKEAQNKCAKLFGADETFFLVNGSTGGILSAVMSVVNEGEKIIVARNCHKSVYNALILSGAKPIYVMPNFIEEYGIYTDLNLNSLTECIKNNKDAKAVIITSPTYEGFVSNIEKISNIVHKNNMIFIVDSAHGAHFDFNDYFPKTPIKTGADIIIQSFHKTLPSLTQTAVIHIKGNRVNKDRLKKMLSVFQSSSPSYIFMASLDRCRDFLENESKSIFEIYINRLKKFRKSMKNLKNIELLNYNNDIYDNGKLVFYTPFLSGKEFENLLFKRYNIQIEMSGFNHIICMTSICDTEEGFEMLKNALFEIDNLLNKNKMRKTNFIDLNIPEVILTPREAFFKPRKSILFKNSVGKISGEFIIPYPPGVPILVMGEKISDKIIDQTIKFYEKGIDILGLRHNNIEKLDIV